MRVTLLQKPALMQFVGFKAHGAFVAWGSATLLPTYLTFQELKLINLVFNLSVAPKREYPVFYRLKKVG